MKFVIFDIDGTLANTKKVEDRCFMTAFEQTFGINIWNQKWETLTHVTDWGITEEIIQRELSRNPSPDDYSRMISNFLTLLHQEKNNDKTQFREIPGAKDFFDTIKGMEEFKLGIATGAWEQSAKLKLDTIGISTDDICFSNSDYHKSREAITVDVIDQLTLKYKRRADQIIYFGDGQWDFKTCQNLGIKFIGIDNNNDGKLKELGAKHVFNDYSNKKDILAALD